MDTHDRTDNQICFHVRRNCGHSLEAHQDLGPVPGSEMLQMIVERLLLLRGLRQKQAAVETAQSARPTGPC
jgi:hypothetical protein